jgi:hypothetical protein
MRILIMAVLAAAAFPVVAAQPLLPAGGNDQVPRRLVTLPAPEGEFERKPVSFSWKLDPAETLSRPEPHVVESREYWQTVEGSELERGFDVNVSAPGALIRVSPAREATRLDAADLALARNGRAVPLQSMASDVQLQAAGMAVEPGTAVIRMEKTAAAGRYRLQAAHATGRYVVHVFEPQSDVVLRAQANGNHALSGDTIEVGIAMQRAGRAVDAKAEALLVAPDGRSLPVAVTTGRSGAASARVRLPKDASSLAGLWELQVFANDGELARDARTAFAVTAPTARLGGDFTARARQLKVTLPVEVASTGRYEVRGTLYATGPDKLLHPVSQGHSAGWFEPGKASLELAFNRGHLPAGYGAPFEVRQLELRDQTRMAPIELRERGLRF